MCKIIIIITINYYYRYYYYQPEGLKPEGLLLFQPRLDGLAWSKAKPEKHIRS